MSCVNRDCWNYGRIKRPELLNGRSLVNGEEWLLITSHKSLITSRKKQKKQRKEW